jgi:uncharacterized protein with PIN domain
MKPEGPEYPRFTADCMLGKLARWLRILGFDTTYFHNIGDRELLVQAKAEHRLVLTRDRGMAASAGEGHLLLVDDERLEHQLRQVIGDLDLQLSREKLFSRCIECGGPIRSLSAEETKGRIPDYVQATQRNFSTCPNCRKIYWNSTHVSAMLDRIDKMGIRFE